MIHFRVNVTSKSVLSVTSSKKSCLIEVMFSIIVQSIIVYFYGNRTAGQRLWFRYIDSTIPLLA